MTQYPDTELTEGYYEVQLGFFWSDGRDETPQNVTVDFQLTDEMEEDYPGENEYEEYSLEQVERMKEEWVQHHLTQLLNRDMVTEAYSNEYISSVEDLREEIDEMRFDKFYI